MFASTQVPATSPGHLALRQQLRRGDLLASAARGAPLRARRAGAATTLLSRKGVFAAASKSIGESEAVVESDFLVRESQCEQRLQAAARADRLLTLGVRSHRSSAAASRA